MTVKVNIDLAKKVLKVVDKGLSSGLGVPTPGKMCVEAAVSYASDEDHNDKPSCVHPKLASEKISLNDEGGWKSKKARARGLRRVAIAQLGSKGRFVHSKYFTLLLTPLEKVFLAKKKKEAVKEITAFLKKVKGAKNFDDLLGTTFEFSSHEIDDYGDVVHPIEDETDNNSAAVAYANILQKMHPKWKRQKCLMAAAEAVVQVLKKMKIPGTKYLHLTEGKKRKVKATRKKRQ